MLQVLFLFFHSTLNIMWSLCVFCNETTNNPLSNNDITYWVTKSTNLSKMTFFTKHLKSHALGHFQICKHLCAMECETSYPNVIILFYMIEHFIWMDITSMSMIQQISNILGCSLDYFPHQMFGQSHDLTNGRCLANWSWHLLWTNFTFIDGWVFDDRPNYPMCLSFHFKVAMIL